MKATDKSTRLNRRTLLAGAAAVAAPVPALAGSDDPIFAAIAARKATYAAESGCGLVEDGVLDALMDDDGNAIHAMLRTPPATLPGVTALVRYVSECEAEERGAFLNVNLWDDDAGELTTAGEVLLRTLLTALERIA